jgi:hypothetical protein
MSVVPNVPEVWKPQNVVQKPVIVTSGEVRIK